MQTTGQLIINEALTRLGVLEQGGTPSASDSNAGLANLNSYWDAAGVDEGLIFAVQASDFVLPTGTSPIPIGPTATAPFNVAVPQRVYQAFIVSGTDQNEIDIVSAEKYYKHNDLAATSSTPDEIYIDYNYTLAAGLIAFSLYPWNTGTPKLRLIYAATFVTWSLVGFVNIPPGYFDLLAWVVAFRSLSTFGVIVNPEVAQNVTINAKRADSIIREANSKNRQQPSPLVLDPTQQLAPPPAVK